MLRKFNSRVRRRNRRNTYRTRRGALGRIISRDKKRMFKKRGFRLMRRVQLKSALMSFRTTRTVGVINYPTNGTNNPEYYLGNFSLPTEVAANDQLSALQLLYRWYKCVKAVLIVRPVFQMAEITAGAGNAPYAQVISGFDRARIVTPASGSSYWETLRNSGVSARETFGPRVHVRKWTPYPVVELSNEIGGGGGAGRFNRSPWIMNDLDVTTYPTFGGPLVAIRILNNSYPGSGLVHSEVELKTYWLFKDLQTHAP